MGSGAGARAGDGGPRRLSASASRRHARNADGDAGVGGVRRGPRRRRQHGLVRRRLGGEGGAGEGQACRHVPAANSGADGQVEDPRPRGGVPPWRGPEGPKAHPRRVRPRARRGGQRRPHEAAGRQHPQGQHQSRERVALEEYLGQGCRRRQRRRGVLVLRPHAEVQPEIRAGEAKNLPLRRGRRAREEGAAHGEEDAGESPRHRQGEGAAEEGQEGGEEGGGASGRARRAEDRAEDHAAGADPRRGVVGHALPQGGHERAEKGLHGGERGEDHAVRGAPHPHQDHDGEGGRRGGDDAPHSEGAEEVAAVEAPGADTGDPRQDQDGHLAAAATEGEDGQLDASSGRRGHRGSVDRRAEGPPAGRAAAEGARAAERGAEVAGGGAEGQEEAEVACRGRAHDAGFGLQDQGLGEQEALVQDRYERAAVPPHRLLRRLPRRRQHCHRRGRPPGREAVQEADDPADQVDRGPEGRRR
mmetsp:Transcript_3937/g.11243  ORF Transcript_3937/g.11243 Transcript_3937/m.11243 type:complete len:473 (-) Transcript_3937:381-1799(-)